MKDQKREPLMLQEGRYYRAIDGGIHGPMIHEIVANVFKTPLNGFWGENGQYHYRGHGDDLDLVEEVLIVGRKPATEGVDFPRLPVGTAVNKVLGYPFPGIVVSAFHTLSGQERFVVEASGADYRGMLHIFNGDQLRATNPERDREIADLKEAAALVGMSFTPHSRPKKAPSPPVVVPLFWYRPVGEDGGYEGPLHAFSLEFAAIPAEKRGEWQPLYPAPASTDITSLFFDSDKLVERLRNKAETESDWTSLHRLLNQAAEEIERLQLEVTGLSLSLEQAPTPTPQANVAGIVPPHCTGYSFCFDPGVLHVKKDGSGYIAVNEDDFVLEDDRCEGPDGPEGSVHWISRMDASEITALRNFLNGTKAPEPIVDGSADE